jgi:hypothetical protein
MVCSPAFFAPRMSVVSRSPTMAVFSGVPPSRLHGLLEHDRARFADDGGLDAGSRLDEGQQRPCAGHGADFAGEGGVGIGANEARALVDEVRAHRHEW